MEEELEEGVENNAALLNSKSKETKGRRVTTSLAGLLLALLAGVFGGESHGLGPYLSRNRLSCFASLSVGPKEC